jgi:nitroimidazol reductase NimA-like FMN-containing flavoprotein (pyridoxamine 5'-phosphate oxidase superfamily)
MGLVKIPKMTKEEYDELISKGFLSRIAFKGDEHPYIAPFLYVFDSKHMFFLPTKYGKKIKHFNDNPNVVVEVESYADDLSVYAFVSLLGTLEEVTDPEQKNTIRQMFIQMINEKGLSNNVMAALGHSPDEPLEVIKDQDNTFVWKLVNVKNITALKNGN